jgi:flagellar biosynthesis/type III secretory pathway ATPase
MDLHLTRQETMAQLALLGDYIADTTKELNEAIERHKQLQQHLQELQNNEIK